MESPERIRRLAAHKLKENLRFEAFLCQCCLSSRFIDSAVRRLWREEAAKTDCSRCARCCQHIQPEVAQEDAQRLALAMGVSQDDFERRFLRPWERPQEKTFRHTPCPLLRGKLCLYYEHRPKDCRSYPHLDLPGFRFRIHAAIGNSYICPIVYRVLERLKQRLWPEFGRRKPLKARLSRAPKHDARA